MNEQEDEAKARSEAAAALGRVRSAKKAAAVRENGKKGGRPPGAKNKPKVKPDEPEPRPEAQKE